MRNLVLIFIVWWGCNTSTYSQIGLNLQQETNQYRITGKKVAGWSMILVSGFLDGSRDAYSINRKVFEQKWSADPYGFWGSESWRKLYTNPNLWNKNMGVFDFWHISHDISVGLKISGGVMIVIGEPPKWLHLLIDFGVSLISQSIGYKAGWKLLHN